MYIGMHHLEELCSDKKYKLQRCNHRYGLIGWAMLETAPTPYNLHVAYVTSWDTDLSQYTFPDGIHLVLLAPENANLEQFVSPPVEQANILIVACKDTNEFILSIQEFFEYKLATGLLAESLLEIMSFEGGVQGMVDHTMMILGNPIFVFDSSFNLIAANWDEAEKHGIATNIIENKGFSESEFSLANRDRIHERVRKSERPFVIYQPDLGFEQMLVAIDTNRDLGHVVVCAVNRPFNSMDYNSLWILKRNIDQQMKKDEFIRNSKGFHYENFLKDLLDGKIATGKNFLNRMQYVGVEFSGTMSCIVIEMARTSSAINPYRIRNLFENRFPNTKTLIYNGQIIVLLSIAKGYEPTAEEKNDALRICIENGLYAGMSNWFEDIIHFSEYYKQALRAIELGIAATNHPNLFLYENYYLDHMKNIFLQKESADTFCHPKMRILLDYDLDNNSQLAYTLYMYLFHERNMGATATAMHMHRSSLTYRFKKIFSLIGDDFEDAKERHYMIMSYEMNKPI